MDQYETLWRARAAEHEITDVDWYVYVLDGVWERYKTEDKAKQRTLELLGAWRPSCGRGVDCSDVAPHLCGKDRDGYFSSVEALLDDEYED